MIIKVVHDKHKRICSCCKKPIEKGDIIAQYEQVIDSWNNTRMWFVHINCLINTLKKQREKFKKNIFRI